MEINYKGKTLDLEFTYNSFKSMQDLNFGELNELEHKPFKMIAFTEQLVLGLLKSDPKRNVTQADVEKVMKEYEEDEEKGIPTLFGDLMEELEKSRFFKSLQKMQEK